MERVESAYEKAGKVLDGVGGPMLPLPDGGVAHVQAVVRKGRLDRIEVRKYNRGRQPSREGRSQIAADGS